MFSKFFKINHFRKSVCSLNVARVNPQSGFTIAELVVVVGIIGLLSIIVFAGYRNYDGKSLLQNLVYEMSLSVREAQIMSIGVRPGVTNTFDFSYGLRFSSGINTNTTYTLVSRSPAGIEALVTQNTLNRSNYIHGVYLCATPGQAVTLCTPVPNTSTAAAFYIRPHLEATFYVDSAVDTTNGELVVEVCPPGTCDATTHRLLRISRSGRVAVE